MTTKVTFLHTVPSLVQSFTDLKMEVLGDKVDAVHIVDEILLKVVLAQGGLSPFIFRRVAEHVIAAEQAGADFVQCTCSSISPCVDTSQPFVSIPVLKIDQPMVDEALAIGERIGIAATAPTTLKPTTDLVYARAQASGKSIEVDALLCEGAYDALFGGDLKTHDKIVRESLGELMSRNDVIILAQASMARVAETIPSEQRRTEILTSPHLAMEFLNQAITGNAS